MSEAEIRRLEERVSQLEKQLELTNQIANVVVRMYVFDGPRAEHLRRVPDGLEWLAPAEQGDRSTWQTIPEVMEARGVEKTHREHLVAYMQQQLDARATSWELEMPLVLPDGSRRWALIRAVFHYDAQGVPITMAGATVDITASKESQEAMRTLTENVRAALGRSETTLWGIEVDNTVDPPVPTSKVWIASGVVDLPSDRDGSVNMMIPPEHQPAMYAALGACVRGETEEYEFEYPTRSDGGRPSRWRYIRGRAIRDAAGKPLRVVGTSMDITRVKESEREVRKLTENVVTALDGSDTALWAMEIDGNANPPALTDTVWIVRGRGGFTDKQTAVDTMAPEYHAPMFAALGATARGETPSYEFEHQTAPTDGSPPRWRYSRGRTIRDADGKPLRLVGTTMDITALKEAEAAKQEATAMLALATRLSGVYVWQFDFVDGAIAGGKLINVWESLGYDPASAPSDFARAVELVIFADDQPAVMRALEACIRGETPDFQAEFRIRHADGSVHWNLARGLISRDADGTPLSFLGTSYDVSTVKLVEEEARRNRERLELALVDSKSGTWDFDLPDGTLMNSKGTWSHVFELLGYSPDDPETKKFANALAALVPPDKQLELAIEVQAHLDGTSREWETVYPVRHKDGSEHWLLTRGTIKRDSAGRARRLSGITIDITERMRVDQALRVSEQRFRALYENAGLGFSITSEHGIFLDCNDMLCSVVGMSRDELLGQHAPTILVPDQIDAANERLRQLVAGEKRQQSYDRRFVRSDGSAVWLNLTFSLIDRDPVRILGVFQDISERKRAEEALRESEQRFRGLYENATLGFAITDERGVFLDCNEMLCSVFGLSREEMIGNFSPAILTPDNVAAADQRIRKLVTGEVAQNSYERRIVRKDGSSLWLQLTFSVVNRDPVRILGTFQDITARVTADQALRESESRFRGLYENAALPFAITDGDGVLVDCNESLCTLFGLRRDEVIGQLSANLVNAGDFAGRRERIRQLVAGEVRQQSYERRIVRRDGTAVWLHLTFSLINRDPVRLLGVYEDITARVLADQALRESEERFRGMFENAGVGFTIGDAKGVLLDVNDRLCELVGRSREELVGHHAASVLLPDEVEAADERVRRLVEEGGDSYSYDRLLHRPDGAQLWINFTFSVLSRDAEGQPTRVLGVFQDITARKNLEDDLRRTKERLELGVRNSGTTIFDLDIPQPDLATSIGVTPRHGPKATLTLVGWENFGYDAATALTDPDEIGQLLHHPDDHEIADAVTQAYLLGTVPKLETEYRIRHADGSYTWRLVRGQAMRDEAGRPTRLIGSMVDITERKTLEEDLRRTRERMELGIRGSGTTIFEIELPNATLEKTRLSLINGWEQFGYMPPPPITDAEQVRAMIVHPDDQATSHQTTARYLRGETPTFESEYRVIHKDGTISWWLTRGEAIRDSDGKPTRLLGSMVNITEMKRMVAQLNDARHAAELANRAKDEFLANVSHEIRTPMNAILGMTELALDASETAHQRQLLSTVKVAARNLLHVINDLLDFSKITAGKLALDLADFSLRAAIGDTLRALAVRAHRKGLELLCDVHQDVPDIYYGDAGRVRQVLMNLIGNAIKFTARGEVVITVSVDPDPSDEWVPLRFTVRDTGIGIAPEKHAAIFRAFEQEDASTTRKFGGTGLGLTISQQLAALMGGRITVESEPGKGSSFEFTARIARSSKPEWRGLASAGPLEGVEVLVVDDNETNRHILLEWFGNWRMRATAVGDAASTFEALERAHESATPFALVLLDSRMPDIDGITLAQKIRERFGPAAHRLILLSSDHSPGLPERSRNAGVDAYLLKPVQQSELLETIWTVMSASADAGPSSTTPAPARRSRTLRILAAEDNELNAALLRELLDQRGHRVTFAGDGRTALDLASRTDDAFDLMLLDLHMPEMDGFEVVQAIRERERTTGKHFPIIALTARSSARDREKAIAAGMDEFLSKPIEVEELFGALERVAATLPAKRPASRLLDARAIVKMSGGRPAVLDRLAEVFRRTVPEQMVAARAALDARDFERLRVMAHKLAGTLSAFSTIAGALASTLEEAAVGQDTELCTTLASRLQAMCVELVEDTRGITLEALEA